jgi:WD40 repeat protein
MTSKMSGHLVQALVVVMLMLQVTPSPKPNAQGLPNSISALDVQKNNTILILGYLDNTVEARSPETSIFFGISQSPVSSVDLHPTNTTKVVVGNYAPRVRIYDTQTGALIRDLNTEAAKVYSVAWNADGTLIAIAANEYKSYFDHRILIWNPNTNEIVHILEGHREYINDVHWSPILGDNRLVSTSSDGQVIFWDGFNGLELQKFALETIALSISWRWDGERVAVLRNDSVIEFFDTHIMPIAREETSYIGDAIRDMVWSPYENDPRIAAIDGNSIKIINYSEFPYLANIIPLELAPSVIGWGLTDNIVVGGRDNFLRIFDAPYESDPTLVTPIATSTAPFR